MAIKDETTTMGRTDEGVEYVAETHAVNEVTLTDGTEMTAEITTTADPNDPTQVEAHMTVTAVAPDGTETVKEYVSNADGEMFEVEQESALENFVEDAFGIEIADTLTPVTPGAETSENAETGVYQAESDTDAEDSDFETADSEFTVNEDVYYPAYSTVEVEDAPTETNYGTTESGYEVAPVLESNSLDVTVPESENAADIYTATVDDTEQQTELAEQQAHTDAAKDAQESADEFIAAGDYAAAAEARGIAEDEAYQAGDDSMLSAYDQQDLTHAAEKQEDAAYYEAQQAEYAQAGDYEAAREAADNAGYAMADADSSAGGIDHTGQADLEKTNMDNALWQESIADSDLENAEYYAEAGNLDAAEASLDSAAEHQEIADNYGDLGTHGGEYAAYDPSSEIETGGSYDSTYDSSYDTTAVDTGFDTSTVDTTSSYDTGTDDV